MSLYVQHCIRVAMKRKADAAYFKGKYEIEMFMMKCFLLPSFDMHLQLEYSSQKRLVNELRTFMLLLFAQKNRLLLLCIHRPPMPKRRTFSLSLIFRPQKQKMELSFDTEHLFWTPKKVTSEKSKANFVHLTYLPSPSLKSPNHIFATNIIYLGSLKKLV